MAANAEQLEQETLILDAVDRFLDRVGNDRYDLVVLDPPYAERAILAPLRALVPLLAPEAMVVVKHFWRTEVLVPDGLARWRERRFGETALSVYRRDREPERSES